MIARGQTPLRDFRRGQRQGIEISRGEGVCWRSGGSPAEATTLQLHVTSELTQNLYYTQSAANGVTIDWGDGSTAETVSDLSATATHTYAAAGDYTVTMTAGSGVTWAPGASIGGTQYTLVGVVPNKSQTYPALTAFVFGEGCELTNVSAFYGCTGLTEIAIPDGTVTIPQNAFKGCTNLDKITLPASLETVGEYGLPFGVSYYISDFAAFCGIDWTVSVEFALDDACRLYLNGNEVVGNITIPGSVSRIGTGALHGLSRITGITMPGTVTEIGDFSFCSLSGLSDITIPSTVQSVGQSLFYSALALEHLEIGAAEIGYELFSGTINSNLVIWLRNTVETIASDLIYAGTPHTIYCEDSEKQAGWSNAFAQGNSASVQHTVVYNQMTRPW